MAKRAQYLHWLTPPAFEDRERARIASTVHTICLIFAAGALISLGVDVLLRTGLVLSPGLGVTIFAMGLIGWAIVLLRRGHPHAAGAVLVGLAWVITTISILLAGRLATPAFSAYLIAIVAGGLLLGSRAAIIVAAASALASGILGILEARGIMAWEYIHHDSVPGVWVVESILFVVTTGLIVVSVNRIRDSLRDAEQSEAALARQNRELAASRERFRALADNASDLIAEIDASGNCLYVTPNLTELLGYAPEDVSGRGFARVFSRAELERVMPEFRKLVAGGSVPRLEVNLLHRDGSARAFETSFSRFRDAAGQVRIVTISRDVTERHRAEEIQAQLHAAMDQAGDSILVVDHEGELLYANAAFAELSGFDHEEIVGRNALSLLGGFDRHLAREIQATLSSGKTWRGQLHPLLLDGSQPVREATFAPVINERGESSALVAVIRDVTREVRLENELRQAQKMEAVGQLAGGVAHDFNNLLLIISGYGQMLQENFEDDPESSHFIEKIRDAAGRAAELTSQLLAFSRRQAFHPRVTDLNRLIIETSDMLRRLVPESVEIDFDLADDLGRIKVDPSQIQQILLNLAANARDAMRAGGRLCIKTENAHPAILPEAGGEARPAVLLSVSDTGAGMGPEVRDRIFEPFFTTKEIGKGTGLGLASVYGIVERSGGAIEVESELDEGTCFRIYLPRTGDAAEIDSVIDEVRTEDFSGATIMVVEDEEGVRELYRRVLEGAGFTVIEARDGDDALAELGSREKPVDVLITDVVMPRMDGPTLAAKLLDRWSNLCVVYASGYPREELRTLRDSRVTFLPKPFAPEALIAKVRDVLAGRQIG